MPPGRPIISGIGTLTELISGYIDNILKPLLPDIPSYIRDTTDFLNKLLHFCILLVILKAMQKILLLLFSVLFMVSAGQAQKLTITPDSQMVQGPSSEFEIVAYGHIKNTTQDSMFVWERTVRTLNQDWEVAFCDVNLCHPPETTTAEFELKPGEESEISLHYYPNNMKGEGNAQICIYPKNDPNNKTCVVWAGNTWALSTGKISAKKMEVYPNPAKNNFNLTLPFETQAKVTILDVLGKELKTFEMNKSGQVNIQDLNIGIYLIQVAQNGEVYTKRFKVQ